MRKTFLLLLACASQTLFAQFHLGAFVGGANYLGELNDKLYKKTKPAIGISLNYELSDRFMLRSGLTFGRIEGSDAAGGTTFLKQNRNLSFQSNLTEFSLMGELTVFNLYNIRWSPYAFGGIAVYHFNPFVRDSGEKVFLQPLGTEGQGLPGSNQNPYKLTQFALPFGGGVKFNINENIRLGVEVGLRRLFTDYLDDVSGFYTDETALLNARGPQAVRFSYRGDEAPGESSGYPDIGYASKNAERGSPKTKDWYYFSGIHLTFRLGGGYGKTSASGGHRRYGCPTVPL
ncbi:MAG TPA: DUF6089 family protein [Flavisolibacter sp.]